MTFNIIIDECTGITDIHLIQSRCRGEHVISETSLITHCPFSHLPATKSMAPFLPTSLIPLPFNSLTFPSTTSLALFLSAWFAIQSPPSQPSSKQPWGSIPLALSNCTKLIVPYLCLNILLNDPNYNQPLKGKAFKIQICISPSFSLI
jgi:hypothetical protein